MGRHLQLSQASSTTFAPRPLSMISTSVRSAPGLTIHSAGDAWDEPNRRSSVPSNK